MKTKAIIFDAGGVIQGGSGNHFFQEVEKQLGLKFKDRSVNRVFFDTDMNLGKISVRKMLGNMYPDAKEGQLQRMLALWKEEWPTRPEMLELVKKLRKRYIVSMLSNSDTAHEERFREEKVLELFEKPVLSHVVHLLKPDERIYKLALENLGLKAGECIFVDDAIECVEGARKLGFRVIHFESQAQCERELREIGVEF